MFGLDPYKTTRTLTGLPRFLSDLRILKSQQKSSVAKFPFGKLKPFLEDRSAESGEAKGHYFHQDLLVAQRIFRNNPDTHVDVGSSVAAFVAHVASFRTIKVIDIRPLTSKTTNLEFRQADLMGQLPSDLLSCCDSLSCLHALEHFGLGRYGDPLEYDGYLTGLDNLCRMLREGGKFYFSVPIGPQRIEFNAHRVFSVKYLLELFADKYRIDHFSFVDDHGDLHENTELDETRILDNFGCWLGCGIFEMTKL